MLTNIKIMYWKEIPVQIQASDDKTTKNYQLSEKFQESVDKVAMFDGSYGSDSYLDGWSYGPIKSMNLDIDNAISKISEKFETFDGDIVQIISKKWKNNTRNESPGSLNYLFDIEGL